MVPRYVPRQQKLGMAALLIIAALSPFIYGAIGFVAGVIGALFYNWIAPWIGGVGMELEAIPIVQAAPPVTPGVLS